MAEHDDIRPGHAGAAERIRQGSACRDDVEQRPAQKLFETLTNELPRVDDRDADLLHFRLL